MSTHSTLLDVPDVASVPVVSNWEEVVHDLKLGPPLWVAAGKKEDLARILRGEPFKEVIFYGINVSDKLRATPQDILYGNFCNTLDHALAVSAHPRSRGKQVFFDTCLPMALIGVDTYYKGKFAPVFSGMASTFMHPQKETCFSTSPFTHDLDMAPENYFPVFPSKKQIEKINAALEDIPIEDNIAKTYLVKKELVRSLIPEVHELFRSRFYANSVS